MSFPLVARGAFSSQKHDARVFYCFDHPVSGSPAVVYRGNPQFTIGGTAVAIVILVVVT